ncbi:MAG: immunoglobulin-like domain-containing protein [Butyrivibrio sp.]|uniref:immunoglobulin-like domain-containing protein n=1 Tax=Butyrivibrio sp. LB2008 TaxID=1408305 RepID=UPI0005685223|nr:immunoglobulin-like domain-containing protein [Butyrivibrio sp. LB2008]MEE3495566.1 immunoglobulin-like domain-containing protein [Butyrivibrio sp.]
MRGNILGIFFTILSGVMIALIVLAYGRSDRMAPEFRFSALDLVYNSQTDDNALIAGINAYDSKDGDISDRIVVEKVVLNKDAGTAVVYYAVADHSGNVTKQSRVFPADIADLEYNGDSSEKMEDNEHPNLLFGDAEGAEAASTEGSEAEIIGN